MQDRQILAALEITDHEVRLLVGEYYDTRVNVLRTEVVECSGVDGFSIKSSSAVAKAIKEAVEKAEAVLKVEIKRVLLAIPSYRVMKNNVRISMGIDNYERKVKIEDLQALVYKGYNYPMPEDKALINWMPLKYYTNRIAFKRMPVEEPCDLLEAEMDLYGADKLTAYDYARCIQEAGLEIVDICLDIYAIAKEAALFEASINKPVVLAAIEHDRSSLAILHNGQISATRLMDMGYGAWHKELMDRYPISEETAHKLIFQNADLADMIPEETPVHLWKNEHHTHQITMKNLNDALRPIVEKWANALKDNLSEELFKMDNLSIVLAGEGAELDGLADYISDLYSINVTAYYPDTIGVRRSYWTCCLGMIYSFIDNSPLYRNPHMSVDLPEETKKTKTRQDEEEDDPVTKRIKSFFQGRNNS